MANLIIQTFNDSFSLTVPDDYELPELRPESWAVFSSPTVSLQVYSRNIESIVLTKAT